jgi:oligosaccharyltransferase complex subunit beta
MLLLVLLMVLAAVTSMPYQVPMLGRVGGKRTLVILDDLSRSNTFSIFFEALESRGHSLSYVHSGQKLTLSKYNQYLYDNVVLFAPTIEKHVDALVDFTENGGNLIIAADKDISDSMRTLLSLFGVEMDKQDSIVIDHL